MYLPYRTIFLYNKRKTCKRSSYRHSWSLGQSGDLFFLFLSYKERVSGLEKYRHFKGTIYLFVGKARTTDKESETLGQITALHHHTLEIMLFSFDKEGYISPNNQSYVLYESTKDGRIWARETEDFYGEKELPDGEKVPRFERIEEDPIELANPQKYVREEIQITVPEDYVERIQNTLKLYKKWLKENETLQKVADDAETESEREEALREVSNHFKQRYGGILGKDVGDRLSVSQISRIWEKFLRGDYRSFLQAHVNLTMKQLIDIGIDKFIYVMGWKKPSDVVTWHKNKLRVGVCCQCQNQFIPMMLQYNHGLCAGCRPMYSVSAIRNFIIRQLNTSKRYELAQHDLLMDFYIIFYHDIPFRKLFLKDSNSAKELEAIKDDIPLWVDPLQG